MTGESKHKHLLTVVHDVSQGLQGPLIPWGDEVGPEVGDVE